MSEGDVISSHEPQAAPAAAESTAHLQKRLGGAAFLVAGTIALSRVIGFFREMYISARFGANPATDAFYAAYTVPDFLLYLVAGGALSLTFIPIYARYLTRNDAHEGDRVFSIVASTMALVLAILCTAGWIAMPAIEHWYLDALPASAFPLAVRMSRILLLTLPVFYLGGIAAATLQARLRFVATSIAPLVYNVSIIAGGVFLGGRYGVEGMVIGGVAGAALGPLALQMVAAIRTGLRFRPSLNVMHPGFREWLRLTLPMMLGVTVVTLDEMIYRHFAAGVPGAVTRMSYARKIVMAAIAVGGQATGQASMPFFARLHAERRTADLADTLARTIKAVAVLCLLAGAYPAALSLPLVDLLFRHGKFHSSDVPQTALYLAVFAAAVPLWGVQGIYARAFYAAHDMIRPMVAGTVVTLASVPVYALAFRLLGVTGLCVASGLAILLHTLALFALLPKVLPEARTRRISGGVLRGASLAIAAGGAAWFVTIAATRVVSPGHVGDLAKIIVGSGGFVGIVLLGGRLLGVDEVGMVLRRVRRRRAAVAATRQR